MPHIDQWVEDGARGRMVPRIGLVESEYPAHAGSGMASGFIALGPSAAGLALSVPSGFWFKPRTIMAICNSGSISSPQVGVLAMLAGGSMGDASATIMFFALPSFPAPIQLDGVTVGRDVYFSAGPTGVSAVVRVAGILVASQWEN